LAAYGALFLIVQGQFDLSVLLMSAVSLATAVVILGPKPNKFLER